MRTLLLIHYVPLALWLALLVTGGNGSPVISVVGGSLLGVICLSSLISSVKAQGKNKNRGKAHRGLALIQKLYRIEKQARRLDPEERYAHRQQQARPVLDDLRSWRDNTLALVPPTSATGKR